MLEIIQVIIKNTICISLIYKWGAIYGVIFSFLIFTLYKHFMNFLLNLEMCSNLDKAFIGTTKRERLDILIVTTFENFNAEKIKSIIIEKAISKLKKFRQKIIYKFGEYFWIETSLEEALNRIQIIQNNFKTESDIIKFAEEDLNNQIDHFKDLPYEIKLIPYGTKGAIIWKFDHVLSDGLGILSLICSIADNYDASIFPVIMRHYKYSLIKDIIDYAQFLYYGPIVIYSLFKQDNFKSPFTAGRSVGHSSFSMTKTYELSQFVNARKKLKISFNDVIMCVLSTAYNKFKELSNGKYDKTNKLRVMVPIGRKEIPNNINQVRLSNEVNSIITKFPIIKDFGKESGTISQIMNQSLKKSGYCNAAVIFTKLAIEFLPKFLQEYFVEIILNNIDMTVSNVPGPATPLFFGGYKMSGVTPMVTTQRLNCFVPIISYNKQFKICMCVDEESKIDKETFIKLIEEEINNVIHI